MPVRNCADTLPEALASTLSQTLSNLEVVVIDDGSTDGTLACVRSARDPRIRLLSLRQTGIVGALEAGRRVATAPLIARMDGDDRMAPYRLARQVERLDGDPTLSLVTGPVKLFPVDHNAGMARYVRWLNSLVHPSDFAREAFVESPVCHPAVTIRASALDSIGGYRDVAWAEDYDLWLRLLHVGHRFASVGGDPVVGWRDSHSRLTRTDPRYSARQHWACKAHHLARTHRDVRIWGAGRDGKRLARAHEEAGVQIACFFDIDPLKVGRLRCGSVPVRPALEARQPGPVILCAVGIPAAREQITRRLTGWGLVEGADFLCVA